MRRSLLAASLVLCAAATPAAAAGDAQHRGGCSYSFVGTPADPATVTAVLDTVVAVYSPTTGNPVSATVTCTYHFHDQGAYWTTRTTSAGGTGLVAGVETAPVPAGIRPGDTIVCQTVDYTSDATPTESGCVTYYGTYLPQPVRDAIDHALDTAGGRDELCAALRAVAPLAAPGVWVAPDGDLAVEGTTTVDC